MPKHPKFPVTETAEGKFRVNISALMSPTGRQQRRFFDKRADAEKFAGKLRTQYREGERSGVISRRVAMEAVEAMRILAPLEISLIEAAREILALRMANDNPETFGERFARIMPLGEEHWSELYTREIRKMGGRLPAWFREMRCSAITTPIIVKALNDAALVALSTQETRMRLVYAILRYKPRHRASRVVAILSREQVAAIFTACENEQETWACALMIYAGIRPAVEDGEITRLDWADISKDSIFISNLVAKTNTERLIPITPALARLIHGHPSEGSVVPANWKRRVDRIRKQAGIMGMHDVTRHTFASHFLAAYGEDVCKNAMGHTAGSRTLFKHYRRAISEKDGLSFFE
jgi:integrase